MVARDERRDNNTAITEQADVIETFLRLRRNSRRCKTLGEQSWIRLVL